MRQCLALSKCAGRKVNWGWLLGKGAPASGEGSCGQAQKTRTGRTPRPRGAVKPGRDQHMASKNQDVDPATSPEAKWGPVSGQSRSLGIRCLPHPQRC